VQFFTLIEYSPLMATAILFAGGLTGICMGVLTGYLAEQYVCRKTIPIVSCNPVINEYSDRANELTSSGHITSTILDSHQRTRAFLPQRVLALHLVKGLMYGFYLIGIIVGYGLTIQGVSLCVLGCILLATALIDIATRIIPNGLVFTSVCVWLLASILCRIVPQEASTHSPTGTSIIGFNTLMPLLENLFSGIAVGSILLVLIFIFKRLTGKQGLGGGDVKLIFAVSLFLGLAGITSTLIIACIMGVVQGVARSLRRSPNNDSHTFPFAPAIALSTGIVLMSNGSITIELLLTN
jgi:leader peptidase (prepilin peptidase) / N-methyltransferase